MFYYTLRTTSWRVEVGGGRNNSVSPSATVSKGINLNLPAHIPTGNKVSKVQCCMGISCANVLLTSDLSLGILLKLRRRISSSLSFLCVCRNCIGQNFATVEIKVMLPLILLRFQMTVEPTKPLVFVPHVFIKPKKGIYLHLKKLP